MHNDCCLSKEAYSISQKHVLKELCEALEGVFDTDGNEEDFSDMQKAYGLLLSVSKVDGHAPEQVRIFVYTLCSGSILWLTKNLNIVKCNPAI